MYKPPKHVDFVSTMQNAERSMEDYSKQILESLKEKFVALDVEKLRSLDERIPNDLPYYLAYIARLLLREWTCVAAGTDGTKGEVIICPSTSSLNAITSKCAKEYVETGMGLKRWMDENMFPLLSKKLVKDDEISAAENIAICIETEKETEELSFRL